jgi:hypothetical protein
MSAKVATVILLIRRASNLQMQNPLICLYSSVAIPLVWVIVCQEKSGWRQPWSQAMLGSRRWHSWAHEYVKLLFPRTARVGVDSTKRHHSIQSVWLSEALLMLKSAESETYLLGIETMEIGSIYEKDVSIRILLVSALYKDRPPKT